MLRDQTEQGTTLRPSCVPAPPPSPAPVSSSCTKSLATDPSLGCQAGLPYTSVQLQPRWPLPLPPQPNHVEGGLSRYLDAFLPA